MQERSVLQLTTHQILLHDLSVILLEVFLSLYNPGVINEEFLVELLNLIIELGGIFAFLSWSLILNQSLNVVLRSYKFLLFSIRLHQVNLRGVRLNMCLLWQKHVWLIQLVRGRYHLRMLLHINLLLELIHSHHVASAIDVIHLLLCSVTTNLWLRLLNLNVPLCLLSNK